MFAIKLCYKQHKDVLLLLLFSFELFPSFEFYLR